MAEKKRHPASSSSRLPSLLISNLEFTAVCLGRGSDATVYEVDWNGTVCAAKRIHAILLEDESPGGAEKFISKFEAECLTWSKLRHPGVVQFLGVYLEHCSRLPVLVMEKMDTSLRRYLENHGKDEFPLYLKAFVLRQVSQALGYLHGQDPPIIHFDLSSNNVLLNVGSFVTKVSDFGLSRATNPSVITRKSSIKGTMAFMAPEALLDPSRYSEKLDIFSFGNIILSTVSHEWPEPCPPTQYEGDQLIALDEFQRRRRHIELFTAQEKQLFLPIVRQCLENRPDKRPSSVMLVQELRHIESILPRGSHVAVPIEQLRQQLSVKEEECRQKDEALREKDEALRDKDAAIQAYRSTLHSQPVKIEPLQSQQAVAEQVHERSYFESSLSSSGHFAATDQQLRQQLSVMEEECRQKDEVIRDKESVIEGKNEALWRLDEIIRKNELVMSEKEEELKQKDITIRAQQIQIQRLTNQPAMSEMLLHEADLEELCYIPFGIKAFSVTPEGGTFPLGTEDASLQFPPGAVTKETYVRYGIILHGPFEFPAGYRLASVVVYLNLGTVTLVKPIYLSLADWCEKKAHVDSEEVMFIRAPHVLKEGKERKYQFSLHAMQNTDAVSVDVLQIVESKCLYTKVLDEGRGVQEWFCATPLHQIDDKCLRVRILFTWLSDTWIKVLEEIYMKQKKWQKHPEVPPLCTQFRINTPVEAIMSDKSGPGWTAILDGVDTIEKEAIISLTTLFQQTKVKSSIEEENYPPSIRCRVLYDTDRKLTGRGLWTISFPSIHANFTYEILTDDSKSPPANVYSPTPSERQILSPFESRMSSGYISGATGLSSQLEYFGDGLLPSTSSHGSRSLTMPSPHATSPITSGDLLCQKPTMKDLSAIVIPRVASEWRNFGLQLDVESHMLNAIVTPNGRSVDHCFVMLGYWLNRRQGTGIKPRTWSSVLEAVADSCGSEVRRDITEELNL